MLEYRANVAEQKGLHQRVLFEASPTPPNTAHSTIVGRWR